ncbi:unnamed protein product [Bursaphelenchus okinawaensis]|uniref:Uncharacterized protein n=1 Tax=Bursaphelenchus okinawaensis TaxID=465554 RepID=A0A811KST9_9BILA|nr:unnamed protein product [Bursaphelenchus okinawaensis]CAG9110314.1 unnamed protein product [Bursaphelenchus okinawaensis]
MICFIVLKRCSTMSKRPMQNKWLMFLDGRERYDVSKWIAGYLVKNDNHRSVKWITLISLVDSEVPDGRTDYQVFQRKDQLAGMKLTTVEA